jgi:hypothetical protein
MAVPDSDYAVTYPAEAHSKDYAPRSAYREHSFGETAKTHSKKENWATSAGGRMTYIACQKRVPGSASLKTSHFAGPARNHEASPVRKRVCPPTHCSYITNFKTKKK